MKHLLEQAQPSQPRKRVKIDQNQRFAEVEDIVAAINQAAAKKAHISLKALEKAAQKAADEVARLQLQSLCTQFQI